MIKNRISWIDVARGIGIILVIYGHTLSSHSFRYVIYAFHMPLFFLLSGLVFQYDKYSLKTTFKKSVKGLLLPYMFFALLSYVVWILNNGVSSLTFSKILSHLGGIAYGNSSTLFFNDILWFLPCLFIAKVGFATVSKLFKRTELIFASLIIFSLVGFFVSVLFPVIRLPFGIESALAAIVFLGLGSIYSTNKTSFQNLKFQTFLNKYAFILLPFLALFTYSVATISFNIYGQQADIRLNHINNYFLFYIAAVSGVVFTLFVSKVIHKNFILEYIGKNTLVLFALHPLVFIYIGKIFKYILLPKASLLGPIYYVIISILIIIFINQIYKKVNRYLFLKEL